MMRALFAIIVIAIFFTYPLSGYSEEASNQIDVRDIQGQVKYSLEVQPGIRINLQLPKSHVKLREAVVNETTAYFHEFSRLFGYPENLEADIFVMPEDEFFKLTKAPAWTNALYYNDQIFIPIKNEQAEFESIRRTLRHEFTHSLVNSITDGNCPGWLDEGLAQWGEGDEIAGLRGALAYWVKDNRQLLSFARLQGGFTGLEREQVAPAYAESLLATKLLVKTFGANALAGYFSRLKDKDPDAFKTTFGQDENEFSALLHKALEHESILN